MDVEALYQHHRMINGRVNDGIHSGIINLIGDRTSVKSSVVNRDNCRFNPFSTTAILTPSNHGEKVFLAADVNHFLFDKALTWIKVFHSLFEFGFAWGLLDT